MEDMCNTKSECHPEQSSYKSAKKKKRHKLYMIGASLVAQLVKNPPAMQETLVQFLGWEDPLEKGWATHSNILGIPWWLS